MPLKFEYVGRLACICGQALAESSRIVYKNVAWGEVRFLHCDSCGSWCQSPQIVPESLAAWYDSDEYQGSTHRRGSVYVNYLEDEAHRVSDARRRYRCDLAAYLPPYGGRVLEIGCATGSLLSVIRDAGHEVMGIDLSGRFADAAKRLHNLDVNVADLASPQIPDNYFHVVLLFGTVSNLSDIPFSFRRVRCLLKSRGTLVLNYPTADSMLARTYGSSFWMFAPSVSTFMTERACTMALEQAGFTTLKSKIDRQVPSLRKLLNHARLGALLPVLERLGVGDAAVPIPLPIPGVRIAWARAD